MVGWDEICIVACASDSILQLEGPFFLFAPFTVLSILLLCYFLSSWLLNASIMRDRTPGIVLVIRQNDFNAFTYITQVTFFFFFYYSLVSLDLPKLFDELLSIGGSHLTHSDPASGFSVTEYHL